MKIALICASPRGKNSSSSCLLSMLKNQLVDVQLFEFVWNRMSCSDEDMKIISECDAVVFAFPLYIDSIPSHLLRCLVKLENYLNNNAHNKPYIYTIINNGFFDAKQDAPAIEVMQNWAIKAGVVFGQGIAVGGGGMMGADSSSENSIHKDIFDALSQLAQNIEQKKSADIIAVLPKMSAEEYKTIVEAGWRSYAKANGLSSSDLDKN